MSPHQTVILQTESMREVGVAWQFVRRPDGWHFVGGSPLFNEVETNEGTTSTTFTDLTTVGPQVEIPAAGQYLIEFRSRVIRTASTWIAYMTVVGPGLTDGNTLDSAVSTSNPDVHAQIEKTRSYYFSGPGLITAKYRRSAGSGTWLERDLIVTPIRLDLGP